MVKEKPTYKAFTLLEVVIAAGILVIISGVAVGAANRAINTESYSKNRTRANMIASTQMERVKAIRDQDVSDSNPANSWNTSLDLPCVNEFNVNDCIKYARQNTSGKFIFVSGQNAGNENYIDGTQFTVSTVVQKVPDDINGDNDGNVGSTFGTNVNTGYPNGLKENVNERRVIVIVSWSEPTNRTAQDVRLTTYLSNSK
jgi:type II secretory pathway pseudopilin PulG